MATIKLLRGIKSCVPKAGEVSVLRDVTKSVFLKTVLLSDVSQAIALCSRYILAIKHTERDGEPRNHLKPFNLINTGRK